MTTGDLYDWASLSSSGEVPDRDVLTDEVFIATSSHFAAQSIRLIDQELNVLTTQARKLADGYWNFHKLMREDGGLENQGYYGTRVRLVGTTLSIVWYRNRFAPDKQNPRKKKVYSDHIAKGSGMTYSRAAFRAAKEWELEAILEVEERYGLIRRRAHALAKMRRALSDYMKLTGIAVRGQATDEGEEDEGAQA